MSIHFLCPFGHRLVVPEHRSGKKGRCPTCHQLVIVPVPNPEPSGKSKKDWDAKSQGEITSDTAQNGPLGFVNQQGQVLPMTVAQRQSAQTLAPQAGYPPMAQVPQQPAYPPPYGQPPAGLPYGNYPPQSQTTSYPYPPPTGPAPPPQPPYGT